MSPDMLSAVESILHKDLVWVVEGGIAYDDFNNGVKLRATRVQLLDDYRATHARALHISLNGETEQQLDSLIELLDGYRARDAMPVVFHLQREQYRYQLRTNGHWSLKPDETCLLALSRCLDRSRYYFDY